MFDIRLSDINRLCEEQNYIINRDIEYAVYSAIKLKKPLLIDGVPGVGKTELAKVLSKIYNAELIRFQCYEGVTVSNLLYDFNYPKQMLYQSILKDKIIAEINKMTEEDAGDFSKAVDYLDKYANFYGDEFLIKKPVYKAIDPESPTRKILLIDELDKADAEVEAFLLETLSDYSISIPEIGTIQADPDNYPLTIITSNSHREISDAFKRRCIYLNVKYPSIAQEAKIIERKANTSKDFALMLAELTNRIRSQLRLKQYPSVSEVIDWASILYHNFRAKEVSSRYKNEIMQTVNVIAKNDYDSERIKILINNTVK